MPVGDKSKRVKRLLEDSMTTHLSSGNPRQERCRNNTRQHHTPTTQRGQLQTGIKVLTGMSVTNLALILAYLANGEIAISFLYHNGSDRPISFPHPTPAGDECLISYPSAFPTQISSTSHPEFLSNALSQSHHFLIVAPPSPVCKDTHVLTYT